MTSPELALEQLGICGRSGKLPVVDLTTVPDLDDKHDKFTVAHFINDPVIADPNT